MASSRRRWTGRCLVAVLELLLAGTATAFAGCARATSSGEDAQPAPSGDDGVDVMNTSAVMVRIAIVIDGEETTLGLVGRGSHARLPIPTSAANHVVQFVVGPAAGSERTYLQPVFRLRPGMQLRLRLLPDQVPVRATAAAA